MDRAWVKWPLGQKARRESVSMVPLAQIHSGRYQARTNFSEEEIQNLAASIREHGLLQPVVVRRVQDGFELVAGERRVRAARLIGLESVPAVVREMGDEETALVGLVENLQRENLNPVEEALGLKRVLEEMGITQEELARRIGKSQSTIANKLRLLKLPPEVLKHLSEGSLTERHAREFLRLDRGEDRLLAAQRVISENLTVQQTERLVEGMLAAAQDCAHPPKKKRKAVYKDLRLFLNAFRQVARELQKTGVEAEWSESEDDDWFIVTVRVPKKSKKGRVINC